LNGGIPRSEAKESRQLLTNQDEKALAKWISTSTATGNPVQHRVIHEMAEKLMKQRVTPDHHILLSIGPTWVLSFLRRHCYLKTKMAHVIESARVKDITKELVLHFNEEFRRVIQEHNIALKNIYNTNEMGFNQLCQ
jgi:Tc5 transposase DNA-binding domain